MNKLHIPYRFFLWRWHAKGTNSFLYKAFSPVNELLQPDNNILHVLDDGSLIHRMLWHRNNSYEQICMNYAQYIRRHYVNNWTVVFDGYPTDAASRNTNAEIYRRSKAQVSTDVIFYEAMTPSVSEEQIFIE